MKVASFFLFYDLAATQWFTGLKKSMHFANEYINVLWIGSTSAQFVKWQFYT